jgi:prephenate dehydrogenase
MQQFNKITIIGVGLIGGSIGLAIKKRRLAKKVIGVFRRTSTLKRALRHKAVDAGVMTIKDGVRDADFIILATPVRLIPTLACDVIRYAKEGALVTDVGSTKKWIVGKIDKMAAASKKVFFVGSHPMAGSEHTGVEFAKDGLLKDSPCIVTKTNRTDKKALRKVADFWKTLGARVSIMSPEKHDRSVSLISHLPHIVAFSLAGAVPKKDLIYAAEGFKDTTRVASSDPMLWADIFLSNKKEVLKSARMFEKYYKRVTKSLSRGEYSEIVRLLKKAGSKRSNLIYGA